MGHDMGCYNDSMGAEVFAKGEGGVAQRRDGLILPYAKDTHDSGCLNNIARELQSITNRAANCLDS